MTTPDGTNGATTADQFHYRQQPVITMLSPNSGPQGGGTTVTVSGAGFDGTTSVTFGGVPGTDVTVLSDSSLTVVSPAGVAGHDPVVTITAPGGKNIPITSPHGVDRFTYIGPVITSITPDSGSTAGGTTVTIDGSGFTGATQVQFGGQLGTDLTVVNDDQLTVVTPAQPAGTRNLNITTPDGTSKTAHFTYVASGG